MNTFKMVRSQGRVSTCKFENIYLRTVGEVTLDIFVLPMSYIGMDIYLQVPIKIHPKDTFKEERHFEYDEDDLNATKEESWVSTMMKQGFMMDQGSSDEELEDDEEEI